MRLAVAGAFHTEYMSPAVEKLQAALAATEIKTPRIPVISNVDAQPHSDPATIKAILAKQVGCGIFGPGLCCGILASIRWGASLQGKAWRGLADAVCWGCPLDYAAWAPCRAGFTF